MTTSPDSVLALLLQWDTAGLRFEGDYRAALDAMYCYMPDADCLSPEPGWDMAKLVRGYSIDQLIDQPDNAAFAITFDVVADLSSAGIELPEAWAPDTVWFRRLNDKWRIVGVESQMPPHFGLKAALSNHAKTADDSSKIRSLISVR